MTKERLSVSVFVVLLCLGTFISPAYAQTDTAALQDHRAQLEAQLAQIEQDISQKKGTLSDLQTQRTSLERDVAILNNKIATAQLQIKQTDLTLTKLNGDITDKKKAIGQVDENVTKGQASLAQLLRNTREIDDIPLAELALSGSVSQIFEDVDNYQTLQEALHDSFRQLASLRSDLSDKKAALEDKTDQAKKVREVQVLAKQAVQKDENEKKTILTQTKGQEKTYQQLIADKQKQAAAIRAELFGLRDSAAIPFGTAYGYAKEASAKTGVRPALILAILSQESNLGENVGSCYVTDLSTGAGVGKNSGKVFANVMKAPRDTVPFQSVLESLGRDWSTTPVSCPQSSGYGGAMGPAQFIPSTWVLYQARVVSATGQSPADPWNARTAVFVDALLMADNGADKGTRAAERLAALRYFAGWTNAGKAAYAFYGDSVMDLADKFRSEIDIIGG